MRHFQAYVEKLPCSKSATLYFPALARTGHFKLDAEDAEDVEDVEDVEDCIDGIKATPKVKCEVILELPKQELLSGQYTRTCRQ